MTAGGEIRLRGRAGDAEDLLMTIAAAALPLTVADRPARGKQQRARRRRPTTSRL